MYFLWSEPNEPEYKCISTLQRQEIGFWISPVTTDYNPICSQGVLYSSCGKGDFDKAWVIVTVGGENRIL